MVYLVGAGPGDPGLITVKALDILRRADVVLYDRLVDPVLLCETKPGCIIIDVGKSSGKHTITQDETANLLVEYGGKGLDVLRLKGGDPFLFGRGAEEAERLSREGIPFAVIPGVSALTAVSAYAGIPLTHRDLVSSVGIATGHGASDKSTDPVRWSELARGVDTIVVFMGIASIDNVIAGILRGGLSEDTPAAVIERGSTPSQRVVLGKLSTIADDVKRENISAPALLVIGKTVALAGSLNWYKPGALAGLTIGITRPFRQSKSFSEKLSALGAQPVLMPTIKTVDTIETDEIKEIVRSLSRYDYLIFSSTNGVESFFRALKMYAGDSRKLAGIKIACIGPVTSEAFVRYGITADITAERFVAEGLLDKLFEADSVRGKRFLLVKSDTGRTVLKDELVKSGAEVDRAVFYSTKPEALSPFILEMIRSGRINIITFTSSSTVVNFFEQVRPDELGDTIKLASIGPQTSSAIRKYNKSPDIEASEYTTAGLAAAIFDACGKE